MRKRLERETGKRCIPAWHKTRGLEDWERITKEYDYVAIRGLVDQIKPREYKYLPYLLKIARKNNCKVHGLGFTGTKAFDMDFYSVDSTNWLSSSRFGNVDYFDGEKMVTARVPDGKKTVSYKIRDDFVAQEYIKFQKYLDRK